MSELANKFGMWWFSFRSKIDDYFMPVVVVLAVISGGICLFSGIHVLRQPILVHIFEFLFTFCMNMIFLFGIMRKSVEDNIKPVVAFPTFIASLVYAIFILSIRLLPNFNILIPWNITYEIAIFSKLEMSRGMMAISIFGGLIVQFLTFWGVARARIQDVAWTYLAYALMIFLLQIVMNFFLNLANYATKIVRY